MFIIYKKLNFHIILNIIMYTNLHGKISNEIQILKNLINEHKIKIDIVDGLLTDAKTSQPYKFDIRILDELIGGYYLLKLIESEFIKNGMTNIKCGVNQIQYINSLFENTDIIRLFTIYIFVNEF
jgi:hypothetical protein